MLRQRARQLRKNSTEAENHLWKFIRCRSLGGYRFKRQVPVGNYIADFLCSWKKLIVKLDGGQHDEHHGYDEVRTKFLNAMGYRVLRFWNHDVLTETEEILEIILNELNKAQKPFSPSLPPPQ